MHQMVSFTLMNYWITVKESKDISFLTPQQLGHLNEMELECPMLYAVNV